MKKPKRSFKKIKKANEKRKKLIVSLDASKLPPNNFESPTYYKKARGDTNMGKGATKH
jgi:hypothetical protein